MSNVLDEEFAKSITGIFSSAFLRYFLQAAKISILILLSALGILTGLFELLHIPASYALVILITSLCAIFIAPIDSLRSFLGLTLLHGLMLLIGASLRDCRLQFKEWSNGKGKHLQKSEQVEPPTTFRNSSDLISYTASSCQDFL